MAANLESAGSAPIARKLLVRSARAPGRVSRTIPEPLRLGGSGVMLGTRTGESAGVALRVGTGPAGTQDASKMIKEIPVPNRTSADESRFTLVASIFLG